jgi:CRP/FNR family cyclic AMP-dependent transcriptional regulator
LNTLSRSSNALELIGEHPEADRLTLPTGACVFRRGEPVQAIHIVQQGLVELISGPRNRIRYSAGELFFYEDLVTTNQFHSRDARALTPLALIRLNRSGFLALIHRHPTLVVELIAQQHTRLRQQRADARHFY